MGSISGGTPSVSNSLIRLAAPPKSRDLDRGAQRFLERKALQLERQRAQCRLEIAEASRASTHFPCCDAPARATAARRSGCRPRGRSGPSARRRTGPSMMLAMARSTSGVGLSAVGRSSAIATSSTRLGFGEHLRARNRSARARAGARCAAAAIRRPPRDQLDLPLGKSRCGRSPRAADRRSERAARRAASSADRRSDSVSPPGAPITTLSADSSASRSSASGWTTTPWADASALNSTKSWVLRKPRAARAR